MKNTTSRVLMAILGIVLFIAGIYRLSTAFSNSDSQENIIPVKINETVSDEDGVEFCVTEVSNVKKVGEDYAEVKTDNNFIVVNIKITNNSNEPYDVNGLRFLLLEGKDEYEYDEETLFAFDNYLSMDTINPNLSEEYTIVYETPSTTTTGEYILKIKPVGFSDDGSVYISLK